jgi:hypothetical protein
MQSKEFIYGTDYKWDRLLQADGVDVPIATIIQTYLCNSGVSKVSTGHRIFKTTL